MRDNFNKSVVEALGKRVGMRCSNPNCRQLTSGPRSNKNQSINIGVAAHIYAASPGGPRYKRSMSEDQRRSIENGIWLCQNCAKLIDNDPNRYTPSLLIKWKTCAETDALEKLEARTNVDVCEKIPQLTTHSLKDSRNSEISLLSKKKLVLIDDDKFLLDDLVFFLEDAGFAVLPASSFDKAVSIISEYSDHIDLAILDLMMRRPKDQKLLKYIGENEETGTGIARWIIKHHPHIRIIGFTAASTKLGSKEWFIKHCAGFFNKPVTESILQRLIEFVREIRTANNANSRAEINPNRRDKTKSL